MRILSTRKSRMLERVPSLQPSDESSGDDNPSDEEHKQANGNQGRLGGGGKHHQKNGISGNALAMKQQAPEGRGHAVSAQDEPVWRKRLRKVRSEKLALEGRSWAQGQQVDASTLSSRPMPSICVRRESASDESLVIHPSVKVTLPCRSPSNVSAASSTFTEIFQKPLEDELISIETPSYHIESDSVLGTSIDGTDEETSMSSVSVRVERDYGGACSHVRTCMGNDFKIMDDLRTFVLLLLRDISQACATSENCRTGRK